MKAELKSKFFDGFLSAVIITAVMIPLILMFRFLDQWGMISYWVAAILMLVAATWMLYRATLEKLSEIGRAWYGIVGGLCAWTVTEISHESGLIDIEAFDIVLVLALLISFLAVMWKYFPTGAKFWIIIFMMNWIGHVYIYAILEFFESALVTTIFTITAAAFGLLIIALLYWIFMRTTTRIQRLWAGLWIWLSLAMLYFLLR
jgi:hypothetical protein